GSRCSFRDLLQPERIARDALFEHILHPRPHRTLDSRVREHVEPVLLPGGDGLSQRGFLRNTFIRFRRNGNTGRLVSLRIRDPGWHVRRAQERHAHPRAALAQVVMQRFGERHDRVLRHAVGAHAGRGDQARHRRGIDDVALVLGDQARGEGAHAVHYAEQIDAEDPLPFCLARFPNRPGKRDARVVADHVNRAQLLKTLPRKCLDFGGLGHVQAHDDALYIFAIESRPGFLQTSVIDIGEREVHALVGEGERHGAAQPARRPRDHGDLASELVQRHECHSMDAPPPTIKVSMKTTCSLAPTRVTSAAAMALPGMLATPITTPVKKACASSRLKRWKSAALVRSSAIDTSASVASTAGPLIPVPRRSDTRITPVPVASPLASPKMPEPTARPGRFSMTAFFLRILRSGTEAITAKPRMVPTERASSTL